MRRVKRATFMELWLPQIVQSGWFAALSRAVRTARLDNFVDAVLVLNALVVGWQNYLETTRHAGIESLSQYNDGTIDTWAEVKTVGGKRGGSWGGGGGGGGGSGPSPPPPLSFLFSS